MDTVYKNHLVPVPFPTRCYNAVRLFFKIPFLESFLLQRVLYQPRNLFHKLIPPVYLYTNRTVRLVKRHNFSYALDISRLLDHSIFFDTLKEPAWNNLLKFLKKDFIIVDAGANIGYLSLHFAAASKDGFVFSFEPDSESYRDLKNNVRLNGYGNIQTFPFALGAKSGKALLFKIHRNNPAANRILPIEPTSAHRCEQVEVKALDEIAGQIGITRVDLMKIDVEGFELFVLQGACSLIRKWKPILFVELAEVNLRQHGFTALWLIKYIENMEYVVLDARTMETIDRLKADHHTDIICFSN